VWLLNPVHKQAFERHAAPIEFEVAQGLKDALRPTRGKDYEKSLGERPSRGRSEWECGSCCRATGIRNPRLRRMPTVEGRARVRRCVKFGALKARRPTPRPSARLPHA
jgi:hypothetical protein